jgi:hypothetical protein
MSKVSLFNNTNIIKVLLLTVFTAASALSIKATYDLLGSDIFPVWFVPGFILTIIILISMSLYFVFQISKRPEHGRLLASKQSISLWTIMILSFISTTSVHGFYPFHRNVFWILPTVDSMMKINYAVVVVGLFACIVFAGIYLYSPMKHLAVMGLMMIALLLLIPNDNCANPFNYWWIKTIGASPLMYVPNMYAAIFVVGGLNNVHPKGVAVLTLGVCVGSLLLGAGHQLGIIW